jgi:REP element-mobilizing transposase RayT
MDRFRGKYRTDSSRLQHWDYSWPGLYYVTVCTKNKAKYFGEIEDKQMRLSRFGKIAEKHWLRTFTLRKDMNLTMGEYVVMPNHFHAIIGIGENSYNSGKDFPNGGLFEGRDAKHRVSTGSKNKFGPQSKNLGSIMRGFKSAVTTSARKLGLKFAWQPRYHDHIIRDEKSYDRIRNYIRNNPKNWEEDSEYQKNRGSDEATR